MRKYIDGVFSAALFLWTAWSLASSGNQISIIGMVAFLATLVGVTYGAYLLNKWLQCKSRLLRSLTLGSFLSAGTTLVISFLVVGTGDAISLSSVIARLDAVFVLGFGIASMSIVYALDSFNRAPKSDTSSHPPNGQT